MTLEMLSLEPTAEGMVDGGNALQSLIVLGKKLCLYSSRVRRLKSLPTVTIQFNTLIHDHWSRATVDAGPENTTVLLPSFFYMIEPKYFPWWLFIGISTRRLHYMRLLLLHSGFAVVILNILQTELINSRIGFPVCPSPTFQAQDPPVFQLCRDFINLILASFIYLAGDTIAIVNVR